MKKGMSSALRKKVEYVHSIQWINDKVLIPNRIPYELRRIILENLIGCTQCRLFSFREAEDSFFPYFYKANTGWSGVDSITKIKICTPCEVVNCWQTEKNKKRDRIARDLEIQDRHRAEAEIRATRDRMRKDRSRSLRLAAQHNIMPLPELDAWEQHYLDPYYQ